MSLPTEAVFGHPSYAQMERLIAALGATVDSAMSGSSSNPVQNSVIKAYVDGLIGGVLGKFATIESSSTASKAYSVGDYLVYDGDLYKVTTAIASGGTITPNTNVEQTTVGAEIANRRLWFKDVAVSAITGSIIDLQDSRITADYVLEGGVITWGDSSKITSLTNWSTDTAGHFIVTGTASAATTATFSLVKADQRIEPVSS